MKNIPVPFAPETYCCQQVCLLRTFLPFLYPFFFRVFVAIPFAAAAVSLSVSVPPPILSNRKVRQTVL